MRNARGKGRRRKRTSRLRIKTYSQRASIPFLECAGRITFLLRPWESLAEGGCATVPLVEGVTSSAATLACVLPARAQPYQFSPVHQRRKIRMPRALWQSYLRPLAGRSHGTDRVSPTFFLLPRLPSPALLTCS